MPTQRLDTFTDRRDAVALFDLLRGRDPDQPWGLMTRMAAEVTAHSVGMMVNALLGRSVLKLADLAV